MAEITEELRVLVTAEVDKAVRQLQQVDKQTKTTGDGFEKLGKLIGTALATKAAIDFGKASVSAAEDARKTFSLLKTTIDTTGAAAWTNIDAMAQMAKELSGATNYSEGEIQSMQTVLLGFKNITGNTFKETTNAILDMATVMGMDLKSAAQAVGKALDDPINGVDSLSRQGFKFTDSQKSMLKSMVATGKQAEAQKIILNELNTTYGGTAKTAQTSFAKLEHSMDTLKETVGGMLTPVLADVAEKAINLVEKFNSLDAGTQRAIVTATALVAATPAVITAIGGVRTALVALGATAPELLAISAAIAAITAVTVKVVNSRNAFKDLAHEIEQTENSTTALLTSYASGNDKKKLDAQTTEKLIELYPELSGKITAYKTTVEEAAAAQKKLNDQKIIDAASGELAKLAKMESAYESLKKRTDEASEATKKQIREIRKVIAENPQDNNGLNLLRAQTIRELEGQLAQMETDVTKTRETVDAQVAKINQSLAQVGKTLKGGVIVDLDVAVDSGALPKKVDSALDEASNDVQKAWHAWLSSTLGMDEKLFKTGEDAANMYIDGIERAISTERNLSDIFDNKLDMTAYWQKQSDFFQSQMSDLESKIKSLLNINPAEIDEAFQVEDKSIQKLIDEYKKLKVARHDADFSAEESRLNEEIRKAAMSEKELYLETQKVNDMTDEELEKLGELFDTLQIALADNPFDQLALGIESSLNKLDLFSAKTNKILAKLAADLAEMGLSAGVITGMEAFGEALGEGENAADSMKAALAAMSEEILNQLPTLFLQAGLQLIAQGQWPLGLGFIAAAGSTSLINGYVQGKKSSATEENALGGVYGDESYAAFAKGGTFTNAIVTSPTFFKFARGGGFGTGLMGEAGPEAVMPLTRGADGSLGVDASGIGGGDYSLTVVVNNYGSDEVTAEETTDAETGQRKLEITVGALINSHLANGKADKALKTRYGLKVQGV